MEPKEEETTVRTKTERTREDGNEQMCNEATWTYIQAYTRRLSYMPSDVFRSKMESLRTRLMEAIDKADNQTGPEAAGQLRARIVEICDQDGIPLSQKAEESSDSSDGEQNGDGASPQAAGADVKKENVSSGSQPKKGSGKKRKSKEKVKPEPVVFLEDDAEDDIGYEGYY